MKMWILVWSGQTVEVRVIDQVSSVKLAAIVCFHRAEETYTVPESMNTHVVADDTWEYFSFFIPFITSSPFHVFQAAELAPALQTDIEVKEAIQGAIQGENSEVVQIVTSVATWEPRPFHTQPRSLFCSMAWRVSKVNNCIQSDKQSSQKAF